MSKRWRVQSGDDGSFDELVVHIGKHIIHIERMSTRDYFVDLCGQNFYVGVRGDGTPYIRNVDEPSKKAR